MCLWFALQVKEFLNSFEMGIYVAVPYKAERLAKGQMVAVRYDETEEEWYTGEKFFAGQITLVTKSGVWVKLDDGEFKLKLNPARYFLEWCFIAEKPESQIPVEDFISNVFAA